MAHRILGLDIGTRAVRLAIIDKSLRQTTLAGFDEEPVGDVIGREEGRRPDDPIPAGHEAAIKAILQRNQRPDDVVAVALPTRYAMHRALTFPFRDDKAIAEAVGFELENHIPTPISDLVVDFLRTGTKDDLTEVLALAAHRDVIGRYVEAYKRVGVESRHLGLQSLCYAALVKKMPDAKTGVTMFVDVGAKATETVVLLDGRTQFLRSFAVGGDTVAQLYAQLVQSDLDPAELLRDHAVLLEESALEGPRERALADATQQALQPLMRELRLTLSAWMRKSHRQPDRMVLTGGLAGLNGLCEFVQRTFGMPVEPLRLGEMPDVRYEHAGKIGDRAALAVALGLAAADVEGEHDVDFRQGDLAYEGDFKVLRQRLPQLVAFAIVALCLLGIKSSLSFRALVIEQEQQLATLQVVSKQLTGKPQTDFEAVKRELERAPTVDITSLYPDISAFKALEDVSNILDKVTEPPDYTPPGGPDDPPAPQPPTPGLDMVRPEPGRPPAAEPRVELPAEPPTFRGMPDIGGAPPRERMPMPEPGGRGMVPPGLMPNPMAGAMPPAPGDAAKPADDGSVPKPPGAEGHHIELTAVQIDRNHGTLRGDADTQDALLALQQALDNHRCFGKVKSSSDRITFERHKDWFKFTVEFEVACPAAEEPAKKSAAGKADGTDKADGKKTADDEEEP